MIIKPQQFTVWSPTGSVIATVERTTAQAAVLEAVESFGDGVYLTRVEQSSQEITRKRDRQAVRS